MKIQYLEIVTPDIDAVCAAYARQGFEFGEPVAALGNARTAPIAGGGRIGVRAPMHESEEPTVRPYLAVKDIEAATRAAEEGGAVIALPPMELPGQGKCAVFVQGGVQHGLWED